MRIEAWTLAAILAMAAVTYATRAGGYMIMRWLPFSARAKEFLGHVPAAVIGALVAPALASGDSALMAGVGAAFAAKLIVRHDLAAVGAGMAVAALVRASL
ncbi:MAG: AzlD domain-containing protein [Alphaproteobacteria bacterium]|nr:AzlD domain-containing protein [Alphaproteobacteria bacterium]